MRLVYNQIADLITLIGYGVLITALAVELILGSLLIAQKHLEKLGAYQLMERLGRIVVFLHYVPVVFCLLRLYHLGFTPGITIGMVRTRGDDAFYNAGIIWIVLLGFLLVWVCGMIKRLKIMYIRRKRYLDWVYQGTCAPVVWNKKLEAMRLSLGIRIPVELRLRYGLTTPLTYGTLHPKVIIPERTYSDRELEVVFAHELAHICRRDALFRMILDVGDCLCWMCPLYSKLLPLMTRWSETCTDIEAGESTGGGKAYFGTVATLVFTTTEDAEYHPVCMADGERIEERIARMKNYQSGQKRKGRRIMLGLICTATVLVGSLSALAAGESVAALSNVAYQIMDNEDVTEVAVMQVNDGVEYSAGPWEEDGRVIIQNPVQEYYSTFKALAWQVPANHISETPYILATNGGYIKIDFEMEPADETVYIGIVEPDGRRRYVIVSGEVYHVFTLTKDGSYKVYVENISLTTDVQVVGGYFYE